ncbi:SRPBCC family protein [Halobacillus sp. A1]|uniref:SRPBCC family protein n=1 Tax=Halobacillus sp. A1 TaxID=2880262 RepID=UPI0020A638F8|nr:SRPBCC family protein [Halobacillus sp. A1]MCP3030646.1 SRPBCC family protein [Halobacillus sp. A1]
MNNLTKMNILKPAEEIFEAIVDPVKIGNFWFSSSSERWEEGKTITLTYEEYNAAGDITVKELEKNKRIVFEWAGDHIVTITFVESENNSTIIEINEEGFKEESENLIGDLVDNKEGWVYMLTCLKGYMEHGVNLRASLVK